MGCGMWDAACVLIIADRQVSRRSGGSGTAFRTSCCGIAWSATVSRDRMSAPLAAHRELRMGRGLWAFIRFEILVSGKG
jgi:hypothetical protein